MAKLSLSSVLEARKRIRITTILATLLVVVLLFQGLIFNNPKSTQAAADPATQDNGCSIIKLNHGDYLIDENSKIWQLGVYIRLLSISGCGAKFLGSEGAPNSGISINDSSLELIIGDGIVETDNGFVTVTMTGSASSLSLKSLKINSDGNLSSIGPGSLKNVIDKPAVERFGMIMRGFFYPKYEENDCDNYKNDQEFLDAKNAGTENIYRTIFAKTNTDEPNINPKGTGRLNYYKINGYGDREQRIPIRLDTNIDSDGIAWGDFMEFSLSLINNGNTNPFVEFQIIETLKINEDQSKVRYCNLKKDNFYAWYARDESFNGEVDTLIWNNGMAYRYTEEYAKLHNIDYKSQVYFRWKPKTESKGQVRVTYYHDPSFILDSSLYTSQISVTRTGDENYDKYNIYDEKTGNIWPEYQPMFAPDKMSSPRMDQPFNEAGEYAKFSWSDTKPLLDSSWQDPGIPGQREVNLNITEDLTIESGGKIDVSGKGFRGGGSQELSGNLPANGKDNGDGSGGSTAVSNSGGGGGGGHGGHGGTGIKIIQGPAGVTTTVSGSGGKVDDDYFIPTLGGSGGGGGEDAVACYGGPGGGIVKIDANNIIIEGENAIIADGLSPSGTSSCGAGAGGTIQIKARNKFTTDRAYSSIFSAKGGQANSRDIITGQLPFLTTTKHIGGDGGGGRISVEAPFISGWTVKELLGSADSYGSYPSHLNVNPLRLYNNVVPGDKNLAPVISERGTVYVQGGGAANNVKKILLPFKRPGANPQNNFNPYAVRVGDEIQVNISVSNLTNGQLVKITDDWLKTPTSIPGGSVKKCMPAPGASISDTLDTPIETPGEGYTTWEFKPKEGSVTISYYCTIK